jgi:hypothetical protein
MARSGDTEAMRDLRRIPGVGPSIARDLLDIGVRSVKGLSSRNPESLWAKLCAKRGAPVDRCVLYVFRCAVYFASKKKLDPEKLKWWNWKDGGKRSKKHGG